MLLSLPSPSSEPGKQEDAQAAGSVVEEDGIIALPAQLPQAPAPAPPVTRHTHTTHTCYSAWNSVRNRDPTVFQGSNWLYAEGHVMGGGVHRASEKQWSQSRGGEVGCFLYSWERFLFSIFLLPLAGVSMLLIWKHVLTGEGQGNKSNRLPSSLPGPYQLLPPPQRSPSSKSCPPSLPFLFPPNLVALTCTFVGEGGMCSGPASAEGLHGHSCPHLY